MGAKIQKGLRNWNKEEIQRMDRKTREMMTMYGALHPESDVERIYVQRDKGRRELIRCENCIRSKENKLGGYVKNSVEKQLKGFKLIGVIDFHYFVDK